MMLLETAMCRSPNMERPGQFRIEFNCSGRIRNGLWKLAKGTVRVSAAAKRIGVFRSKLECLREV